MSMDNELSEVYAAVDTLYCEPNAATTDNERENLQKASEWLGNLQKSVQSWKIADQLLHMKRDVRSCFFASQTLRTKIQFYFGELPLESHESFRASMLDHLSHITDDTHQGITTQLCVAVADLALLMTSWQDPFGDLWTEFGAYGRRKNLVPFLEVLIALPEELNSRQLRLGQKRREQMEAYCKAQVPRLIELLVTVVSSGTLAEPQKVRVLRCLSSWFNLHCAEWQLLVKTGLMAFVLSIVSNPRIPARQHEIATDCVCATMIMLEEVPIPPLSQLLLTSVLQLEESFHIAVALEDLAAVTNYARMFAELGEILVPLIVEKHPDHMASSGRVLNLLLMCVGHHEWEVAEITFNFWYKLSEDLYRKNSEDVNVMFLPYVERLFEALYRHCQIDVDHEGVLQDSDDFFEFRERVQELIKDVVFICRSKVCFEQMATILRSPDTLKSWHLLEAALFVMQSVAKNLVPEDDNAVVTEVVKGVLSQALPSLDGSSGGVHIQVALTSLLLLAELNEWFKYHSAVLPNVLTFCTQRLQFPPLATVASKALDAICTCCHAHMEPHFDGLMHIVCSLDSMVVTNSAVVGLLKGVTNVLNQFPNAAIRTHMDKLCGLQVEHLNRLLQGTAQTAERGSTDDPIIWLDRLSAIFRHVSPKVVPGEDHPCRDVVMKVWPTISGIMEKYSTDVRVMEHCCRCLRFAVRCVHKDSAPMLPPLVTTIVKLYGDSGHSCFVYLGSILVDEYGTDEGCVSGLISMLEAFTPKTFQLLIQPNGFKNHPDTVDDWFRLCTRFLQRCPVPFLQCPVIGTIIECGLQACLLDHKDANAAVLKFFQDLLVCALKGTEGPSFSTRVQLVGAVLSPVFCKLVDNLITGAIFVLPPYMLHEVAETLVQLNKFDAGQFCAAVQEKLKGIPRTNSSGNVVVSAEQLQDLHTIITTGVRPKDIARALIDFSRFYT